MEKVVWKGTFTEAEDKEDAYWTAASTEKRLSYLFEVREIFFPNANAPMQKIFVKKTVHAEEE